MEHISQIFARMDKEMKNEPIQLRDDEYLGEDKLPHCKNCKTPRYKVKSYGIMPVPCKCQEEKYKREEEERWRQLALDEFNKRSSLSMIGNRYKNARFADAIITDNNRAVYDRCRNYVENAKEAREKNMGLYIYGKNSTGKTHLTACICNELLWRGYSCIYTNLATMLNEIRGSYNGQGIGECELMYRLQAYDFAFIDDLGKEFIGREYNAASSKWAEEKLYEIINARYIAQKPIILSSNYNVAELAHVFKLDKAIIERISEMVDNRIIKLDGDNFRV